MDQDERYVGLVAADRASVFFDGTLTDPQLDHPEGLAVHRDGSIWCGGERGQIYRIDPDGSSLDEVASTGGFCLGMAFDRNDDLFVCDLKHAAVMKVETGSGRVERFSSGAPGRLFRIPNYPAFDDEGRLYVSDSHEFGRPGPGVFRIESDGSGTLWYEDDLVFANGLALDAGGSHLYVVETFANRISRIAIRDDGTAGPCEWFAETPGAWPDGLAFDAGGNLYVGCYEPSQVLRIDRAGDVRVLFWDRSAHLLAHPTNLAFRGTAMFTANLGRWHVTRVEAGVEGLTLPPGGWR